MNAQPSSKLHSIYTLRGLAALAVVAHHAFVDGQRPAYGPWWFRGLHAVLAYGFLGVPLFFVISGFCIHLKWGKGRARRADYELDFKDFWRRRLRRLYPPYLVMLCISMALMVFSYSRGGAALYPEPRPRWMAVDFIAHLFMLHGLHPVLDQGGGNPAYWTLAREEYFYLLYLGLLAWRSRRGLRSTVVGIFVVALGSRLLLEQFVPPTSAWWLVVVRSPLELWFQWCLGAVAVEAYYGLVKLPRWCSALALVPVWFALGLFCRAYVPELESIVWGLTFFTLLNGCVRREQQGSWPAGARVIRWLTATGIFSYSLYLVHPVVLAGVVRVVGPREHAPGPLWYCLYALLLTGVCLVAGKAFYWLVERHFLNSPPLVADLPPQPVPAPAEV